MSKFWNKVLKCRHKWSESHAPYLGECGTPYCGAIDELRCLKCGVYEMDCRCGVNRGHSGWSAKRWRAFRSKQQKGK